MKKLKLYLETSVWNFLFADDAPEKKEATKRFFKEIESGMYEIFISNTVIEEIENAPAEKRNKLFKAVNEYSPVILDVDNEADRMVEIYISHGLLQKKNIADIYHLAIAATNGVEILLSWNMRHMVNLKTKNIVNGTNKIYGYSDLIICTPEEMVDYED